MAPFVYRKEVKTQTRLAVKMDQLYEFPLRELQNLIDFGQRDPLNKLCILLLHYSFLDAHYTGMCVCIDSLQIMNSRAMV